MPEPWKMVEQLAAAGIDQDWLDRVSALAGPATDAALGWVAATLTARSLAAELQESTRRACRRSSAPSRPTPTWTAASLVEVDLHEGLETTLIVLGHKLKHTSIEVVRDYDRRPPEADGARARS